MPAANPRGTPGRAGSQYMPYNDDPRKVGTLTGKPMPTGLQRDSDDYEDVLDYFPSDDHEGDMTGSTSMVTSATISRRDKSRRDVASTSTTVSRHTVLKTPVTGRQSSRLGLMSDDEGDEAELDAGYADQTLDPQSPTSRRTANGLRPPPSVSQPAPSRLNPLSPDVNFDDLPSAPYQGSPTSGRRTTGARGASSRHALGSQHASTSRRILGAEDDDEDVDPDADATQESLGVEMGRDAASRRKSMGKAASSRRANVRASAETELEEPSGMEDDTAGVGADLDPSGYADEQVPIRDEYDGDDGGGDGGYGDANGDVGMDDDEAEESPLDEGGEEAEAEPEVKPKRGKGKGKAAAAAAAPKAKVARTASASVPRARVERNRERSQSEIRQPADTLKTIPNTSDRKRRLRTADERTTPLEYWRGERPAYTRKIHDGDQTIDAGTAVVEAWVRVPKEQPVHLGAARRKGRAKSKSRDVKVPKTIDEEDDEQAEPDPHDVTGWDQNTEPSGVVNNYSDGQTVLRRIVCTNANLNPAPVLGANGENSFQYQKVFVEDPFFAAGVINMDVGGVKSPKPARDNTYVFFVYKGCVEVSVHRTRSIVSEGGLFLIPRGNDYALRNVCEKRVELFFSQARLLRSGEEVPASLAKEVVPVVRSAAGGAPRVNGNGNPKGRRPREEVAEDEDEERSVTPVAKKAKAGAAKRR